MLPVHDGPLHIDLQVNGPLQVRGNLEITNGTGRMIARVTSARLCRCGHSRNKPFCDGSHSAAGFVGPDRARLDDHRGSIDAATQAAPTLEPAGDASGERES